MSKHSNKKVDKLIQKRVEFFKNMTIEKIWKPPFYFNRFCIKSSNNVKLCTLLNCNFELTLAITCCLEGSNNCRDTFTDKFEVDEDSNYIKYGNVDIIKMDGLKYLTSLDGLNLPMKDAVKVQNKMRDWMVKTLNK